MSVLRDWHEWHQGYADPSSSLARRLAVVRRRIDEALTIVPGTPIRVLSLCAGDGRDLLPILATTTQPVETVVLVEKDPTLADAARRSAGELKLSHVTVITGDAGNPIHAISAAPVDLLLLCGIFGNISEPDIRTTIAATGGLLRTGGRVIWTRGSTTPDLRPAIRKWFTEAGLRELSFDSEPTGFGVGVGVQSNASDAPPPLPARLFSFIR